MRKTTFLFGASVGFILGSRCGRGPYEQLETKVRDISRRPALQDKVVRARNVARDQTATVAQKFGRSQTSAGNGGVDSTARVPTPDPTPDFYADPQDLQFSAAATKKQEMVDELLDQGIAPEQLDQKEQQLRQSKVLDEPRAGNKPD